MKSAVNEIGNRLDVTAGWKQAGRSRGMN